MHDYLHMQLYARRRFFSPPKRTSQYYDKVIAEVRAETQVPCATYTASFESTTTSCIVSSGILVAVRLSGTCHDKCVLFASEIDDCYVCSRPICNNSIGLAFLQGNSKLAHCCTCLIGAIFRAVGSWSIPLC